MQKMSANLIFCLLNKVANRFRNDWSGSGEDRRLKPLKSYIHSCKTSIEQISTKKKSYKSPWSRDVSSK